jgi:peroxiredoxin
MKGRILIALMVAISFGVAMTAYGAEAPAAKEGEAPAAPVIVYGQAVGDNLKPVTLETIDGSKKVEVDKVAKKTLFIMISSVCTACRKEIQEMSENMEKFQGKMDIYGVVIDMDAKSAAERIGPVPFPLLADSAYLVGNATNLMSTPSSLIVEKGKIVYTKFGYRPGQWKEYLK